MLQASPALHSPIAAQMAAGLFAKLNCREAQHMETCRPGAWPLCRAGMLDSFAQPAHWGRGSSNHHILSGHPHGTSC
eukprot:scaffold137425_cov22-Tisochrysis_lutea.AAC.1